MVKYLRETQELRTEKNVTHIKQLELQFSNVASSKSPPQGDTAKVGIFHLVVFQTTLWTVFTPNAPTILSLCASTPDSSNQTGNTKPTFNNITRQV
jgi:hypothetical protein